MDTKEIKNIESAIVNCNRAVEIDKSLPSVEITLGRIYTEQGKYEQALSSFQEALERDPKNSDAYRGRAIALMDMGKTKEAELSYKKSIEAKPDYWGGYSKLGVFYFQQGRYEEAAAQFQQVVTLNPNNASGYRNLGAVYGRLGRYDEAIKSFEKSLELEPDYRTYQQIATVYTKRNKFREAARAFEKVLELKNNDYRIWGFLADSYYWIPDERYKASKANLQAIKLALEQLKINPNDIDILKSLAYYYGMEGDTTNSILTLRKIELLHPSDVNLEVLVGQTYEEWLGDRRTALKWIKKAINRGFPIADLKLRPGLKDLIKDKRFTTFIDSLNKSR